MNHGRGLSLRLMTPPSRMTRHLPSEAGEEKKSAAARRAPCNDNHIRHRPVAFSRWPTIPTRLSRPLGRKIRIRSIRAPNTIR